MIDPMQYLQAALGPLKAIMSIGSGISQARQYNANAAVLQQQARSVLFGSEIQAGAIADQGDAIAGAQSAYYGSGNIDVNFGSPLVMLAENADRVNRDIGILRANALTQSSTLTQKASDQAARAHQSRIAGMFGAAGALLAAGSKWPGIGLSDTSSASAAGTGDFRGILGTDNWIG